MHAYMKFHGKSERQSTFQTSGAQKISQATQATPIDK